MQIFSRATITTATTAQYSRAVALAEARLAAVGRAIPLKAGSVTGDPEDGFAWELGIVPIDLNEEPVGPGLPSSASAVTTYRVTVTALWHDGPRGRRLTLSTLRLGEREP